MLVREMNHVDYETLERIKAERKFNYHWEVINFLIEYYKREERARKEMTMTLGKVDYD